MTPIDKPYKPVPVATAKAIAEEFDKSIVIIFAHDPVFGHMHTTTYGVDPQNKAWAAKGGEIATKALGGMVEAATDFEDYRLAQAQRLYAALKIARKLVCDFESTLAQGQDLDRDQLAEIDDALESAAKFLGPLQEKTA